MTSTVTRLYRNRETANQAVAALKKRGFKNHHIEIVEGQGVAHALRHGGITGAHATEVARNAGPSATALLVRAPFGGARAALDAVDPFDTVDLRRGHRPGYGHEDNPSPLSDAMGAKVLIRNNPAPLSRALGLGVLSEKQNPSIQLSHNPAPLSKATGMPVLSAKQNPSIQLSHDAAPLSKALGMRVLSQKQNPDLKLSHNPAPLSSALGLPVLLHEDE